MTQKAYIPATCKRPFCIGILAHWNLQLSLSYQPTEINFVQQQPWSSFSGCWSISQEQQPVVRIAGLDTDKYEGPLATLNLLGNGEGLINSFYLYLDLVTMQPHEGLDQIVIRSTNNTRDQKVMSQAEKSREWPQNDKVEGRLSDLGYLRPIDCYRGHRLYYRHRISPNNNWLGGSWCIEVEVCERLPRVLKTVIICQLRTSYPSEA